MVLQKFAQMNGHWKAYDMFFFINTYSYSLKVGVPNKLVQCFFVKDFRTRIIEHVMNT